MVVKRDVNSSRLDFTAKAGWLYYIAGNSQDEIAHKLGVSRQTAQRLVSRAVSQGLIKIRLDHAVGDCMELGARLGARYGLKFVEVIPSDPQVQTATAGLAQAAAAEIERRLASEKPLVIAIGTGHTLKAAIEEMVPLDAPHHKIVSLTGNITREGSVWFYNVVFKMADLITAKCFPMPVPVIASSQQERATLHSQPGIRQTLGLAARADVAFVGVGDVGPQAALFIDGFIAKDELALLQSAGAVGEIVGWTFDKDGRLIKGITNDRVASAPIPSCDRTLVIGVAKGERKLAALYGALRGHLINGLITDALTAENLLA
ncbi:sugar-binding transcriptional regulator [Rhizobium sp. LC145]|uniref:sugar-binding transcriptional regulator n=1 Tax=Rhizobium sp. LC145 TaxID=1120688 RepID=UPI000629F1F8|nr:sugar-binding transcriptional regulator [Rhizobium sp. LC145]KKX33268.1 DeoR faimly transcriptional regulator [Rhizobium sp. LC145]TKT55879.1 sugar-binding transcriptional regulator [Rhizobiaceae bacterium LC148]